MHSASAYILETPANHAEYDHYAGDTPEIEKTHSDPRNNEEQDQLKTSADGINHILNYDSSSPIHNCF